MKNTSYSKLAKQTWKTDQKFDGRDDYGWEEKSPKLAKIFVYILFSEIKDYKNKRTTKKMARGVYQASGEEPIDLSLSRPFAFGFSRGKKREGAEAWGVALKLICFFPHKLYTSIWIYIQTRRSVHIHLVYVHTWDMYLYMCVYVCVEWVSYIPFGKTQK